MEQISSSQSLEGTNFANTLTQTSNHLNCETNFIV